MNMHLKRIIGHKIDDLTEKTYTKTKKRMAYGRDSKDKIEYYITKNRVKTYHLGSVFCYSECRSRVYE